MPSRLKLVALTKKTGVSLRWKNRRMSEMPSSFGLRALAAFFRVAFFFVDFFFAVAVALRAAGFFVDRRAAAPFFFRAGA